jgi:hypothetical protein
LGSFFFPGPPPLCAWGTTTSVSVAEVCKSSLYTLRCRCLVPTMFNLKLLEGNPASQTLGNMRAGCTHVRGRCAYHVRTPNMQQISIPPTNSWVCQLLWRSSGRGAVGSSTPPPHWSPRTSPTHRISPKKDLIPHANVFAIWRTLSALLRNLDSRGGARIGEALTFFLHNRDTSDLQPNG